MVILATDGLLDNLYDVEIVQCIAESWSSEEANTGHLPRGSSSFSAHLAHALSHQAYVMSRDKERVSPWEEEAVAAGVIPGRDTGNISPALRPGSFAWDASKWGLPVRHPLGLRSNKISKEARRTQDDGRGIEPSRLQAGEKMAFRGGKLDDITVVVATVIRRRQRIPRGAAGNIGSGLAEAEEGGSHTRIGTST